MQNTTQKNSTENTPQNFPMFKLRIQVSSDSSDDQYDQNHFFSVIEKRIESAMIAAVKHQYSVKITLTYGDTGVVRVYQFDTFLK